MSFSVGSTKMVTDGLVLLFDSLNSKSYSGGSTWTNLASSQNNGTISNVAFSNGHAEWTAVDNEYIVLSANSSVNNIWSGGATMCFWCYPTSKGQGDFGRLASKEDPTVTNGTTGWRINWGNDDVGAGFTNIHFYHRFSSNQRWNTTTANLTALNAWHHVVATYDSDDSNNDPLIYIDGYLHIISQANSSSGASQDDSSWDFIIGNREPGPFDRGFDGYIDHIAVYNRILTPNETRKNFESLRSRFGI